MTLPTKAYTFTKKYKILGCHQKGQALLESLLALPFFTMMLSGLLVFLYLITAQFLTEHWVYQAGLCLGKYYPIEECQKELETNLRYFPFHKINEVNLIRSFNEVKISLKTSTPLNQLETWQFQGRLPLGGVQ